MQDSEPSNHPADGASDGSTKSGLPPTIALPRFARLPVKPSDRKSALAQMTGEELIALFCVWREYGAPLPDEVLDELYQRFELTVGPDGQPIDQAMRMSRRKRGAPPKVDKVTGRHSHDSIRAEILLLRRRKLRLATAIERVAAKHHLAYSTVKTIWDRKPRAGTEAAKALERMADRLELVERLRRHLADRR
jgi:hypothetical protein